MSAGARRGMLHAGVGAAFALGAGLVRAQMGTLVAQGSASLNQAIATPDQGSASPDQGSASPEQSRAVLPGEGPLSSSISGVSPAQLRAWMVGTPRPRVLLMRHAQTVAGTGDPPGYRLDDCSTQRNLAEEGRAQARALARLVQAADLQFSAVRSSRWCRCLETARLAFGQAQAWTPLNSFFDAREQGAQQLGQLRAAWQSLPAGQLTAWVTHQVVVTGLTGLWPASGEVFIIEPQPGQPAPRLIARFVAA